MGKLRLRGLFKVTDQVQRGLIFPLPAQHFCHLLWAKVAVLTFGVSLVLRKAKLVSFKNFDSDHSGSKSHQRGAPHPWLYI